MRACLTAALVLAVWIAGPVSAASDPPGTLRVDYFHTGGRGVEIFALDRVTLEPLPWPGHPARTTDAGEPGVYRYEVRDAEGRLLYARGFASIDEFEARQREFQARRKQIRADNRPESEMSALFREERAYTTRLLQSSSHAHAVGAFRGANYDARAYYRPQLDCVMFTRDEVPFCRVCQRALDQVIDLYAGPRRTE